MECLSTPCKCGAKFIVHVNIWSKYPSLMTRNMDALTRMTEAAMRAFRSLVFRLDLPLQGSSRDSVFLPSKTLWQPKFQYSFVAASMAVRASRFGTITSEHRVIAPVELTRIGLDRLC